MNEFNSKKVMERAEVFDGESVRELVDEGVNGNGVVSSEDDVVNVYQEIELGGRGGVDEKGGVSNGVSEARA